MSSEVSSMTEHVGAATAIESTHRERWKASTQQAIQKLPRSEIKRLQDVQSATEAENYLHSLFSSQLCAVDHEAVLLIKAAITKLDSFIRLSETDLNLPLETAIIWGFLALTFKYEHKGKRQMNKLSLVFVAIGEKVEDLTALFMNWAPEGLATELALDTQVAMLSFGATLACHLLKPHEPTTGITEDLGSACDSIFKKLDDIIARAERRKQWESQHDEIGKLRKLLELPLITVDDAAMRSCVMLPPAANARFYDRDNIIAMMDSHLRSERVQSGLRMYGLYGLGGVGKSHVALKYAETKMEHFQTILWIHSETREALEQSFTNISVRLQLKGADRTRHEQNRIEVLNWLRETSCKWLLIYDNVADLDAFWKYRPATSHGSAIVTTRSQALADRIAEARSEVLHFDKTTGSRFILYLLSEEIAADIEGQESESALELSGRLSGHALAISSVAALLRLRSWTIQDFLDQHNRNPKRAESAVETVWRLSFESLNPRASKILSVLAYIQPDSIPDELFEFATCAGFPADLEFCVDNWEFLEVMDGLMNLALIRRDKKTKTLSIHRLVQSQFRYFLSDTTATGNQEAFEDTAKLLYERFPQVNKLGQLFDRVQICQLFSQHVSGLKNHFKAAVNSPSAFKPTLLFCKLLENYRRYLLESTSFVELEDTLQVSKLAYELLPHKLQDKSLLVKILQSTALICVMTPIDYDELAWSYTDIGNVVGAIGRPQEALTLHLKSLEIREQEGSGDLAPLGIAYQNLARSFFMVGNLIEAEEYAQKAVDLLSKTQRWVMVAYTKFVLGNISRSQSKFAQARDEYTQASSLWMEHKNSPTHHFRAACFYKRGCCEYDMYEYAAAILSLGDALAIATLHQKVMPGDYARILHKLAEAKENGDAVAKLDAAVKRKDAERLLSGRRSEAGVSLDVRGEAAYDALVYILWR